MKTIELITLSATKAARIQEMNDGGYRVSLEQTYNGDMEVIAAKYTNTLTAAKKKVEGWK